MTKTPSKARSPATRPRLCRLVRPKRRAVSNITVVLMKHMINREKAPAMGSTMPARKMPVSGLAMAITQRMTASPSKNSPPVIAA